VLRHLYPALVDRAEILDPRDIIDRVDDVGLVDHPIPSIETTEIEDRIEPLVEQLDRGIARAGLEEVGYRTPED
jgi:hypothetical protein